MKRFILTGSAVIFALIFAGCEITYYPVTVENKSSKPVGYFYNGGTDTLQTNESRNYQVRAYTQEPSNIAVVPPGTLTVKMVREGEQYIFENITSINLSVINTLPFPVTIRAGNYIAADGTGKTELEISGNSSVNTAKIYTSKPEFAISADYPVGLIKVEWEMKNGTIFVTIK
jgi:hypothetical protein